MWFDMNSNYLLVRQLIDANWNVSNICYYYLSNYLCVLPFVLIPIQLRYLESFFEMYVFPRAGRPTIAMT